MGAGNPKPEAPDSPDRKLVEGADRTTISEDTSVADAEVITSSKAQAQSSEAGEAAEEDDDDDDDYDYDHDDDDEDDDKEEENTVKKESSDNEDDVDRSSHALQFSEKPKSTPLRKSVIAHPPIIRKVEDHHAHARWHHDDVSHDHRIKSGTAPTKIKPPPGPPPGAPPGGARPAPPAGARPAPPSGPPPSVTLNHVEQDELWYDFQLPGEGPDVGGEEGDGLESGLPPWLSFAAVSHSGTRGGVRKVNQDRFVVMTSLFVGVSAYSNAQLFAVLDGHGEQGHSCAQHLVNKMPGMVRLELKAGSVLGQPDENTPQQFTQDEVQQQLTNVFLGLHKSLLSTPSVDSSLSGATCTAMLISGRCFAVANAGDCRAVLAREVDGVLLAVDLSKDNVPGDPEEQARIVASGGYVEAITEEGETEPSGPLRVWSHSSNGSKPGVAMARSLGDLEATQVGVIPDPVIQFFTLNPWTDMYAIIASDGVWEFITSQEAIDLTMEHGDPHEMAERLAHEARQRWKKNEKFAVDDITVIVLVCTPAVDKDGYTVVHDDHLYPANNGDEKHKGTAQGADAAADAAVAAAAAADDDDDAAAQ